MPSTFRVMTALLLLLGGTAHAQSRPAAPGAHCLDARAVREMHQPSARSLAVIDHRGGRHRIDLADACPIGNGTAALDAPNGWVCGARAGESLRVAGARCAVTRVSALDAREFAALALTAARPAGSVDLAPVEVTGTRRRGFGGTFAYCFSPAQVRAWSDAAEGLQVEVRPSRSGGNRFYRVELGSSCPELGTAQQIAVIAGRGNGLVCGNAGDRVTNVRDPDVAANFSGRLRSRAESEEFGCPITAVYPLEGPARSAALQRK